MFTRMRNCLTARARQREDLRAQMQRVSEAHLDNLLLDRRIARAKSEQMVEQNEPAPEAGRVCPVERAQAREAVSC
jgi:tRNA(Ile)-lysidine synthase TilS/MesJ